MLYPTELRAHLKNQPFSTTNLSLAILRPDSARESGELPANHTDGARIGALSSLAMELAMLRCNLQWLVTATIVLPWLQKTPAWTAS